MRQSIKNLDAINESLKTLGKNRSKEVNEQMAQKT